MLKRFILWDFPRASWQYDVMVGLIVAFIFLTPRDWFRDQPRIPNAGSIVMMPSENGHLEFFALPETLAGVPESQQGAKIKPLLEASMGKKRLVVTRVQPVLDSEGALQGYFVFARP